MQFLAATEILMLESICISDLLSENLFFSFLNEKFVFMIYRHHFLSNTNIRHLQWDANGKKALMKATDRRF